jgi:hypothetical protein
VRVIAALLPVARKYGFAEDFHFDVLPWSCHITLIIPQSASQGFESKLGNS